MTIRILELLGFAFACWWGTIAVAVWVLYRATDVCTCRRHAWNPTCPRHGL